MMSDQKTEQTTGRAVRFIESETGSSENVVIKGQGFRIDSSHGTHSDQASSTDSASVGVSPSDSIAPPAPVSQSTPRGSSQLLLDAGRLVQQLQDQLGDIDRREAELERRLAEFESEQRHFRELQQTFHVDLEKHRSAIKSKLSDLNERSKLLDVEEAKLAEHRADLDRARCEFDDSCASRRNAHEAELESERQSIDAARAELATEQEWAATLVTSLEQQHRQATNEAEKLIQSERERLWESLVAEWEERRNQFQVEHDAWVTKATADRLEIEREKAFYESAVRESESKFAVDRETHLAALQSERQQHLEAMNAERQRHQTLIDDERQKQLALVESQRIEWEQTRSSQLKELTGERSVLENRIRFQQEHLERLRTDLDKAQNEHRRQIQIERNRIEESSQLLLKRMQQIDLYRQAVDEREKSIEREHDTLVKSRRALTNTTDNDRLALHAERLAWEQEKQIQEAELRRKQELLATHADGVENRRVRLDKLRVELEETHRATLEMRLAVEEVWGELTQTHGTDAVRERVEAARQSLVGQYQMLMDNIAEQRRESSDNQSKLERMRAEFMEERLRLTEWIANRDGELRVSEERLRLATADSTARDAAWQIARDQWLEEKANAERVIRRLLAEQGERDLSIDDLTGKSSRPEIT